MIEFLCALVQVRKIKQCLLLVLNIFHQVVLRLNKTPNANSMTIEMKATEQYFPVVLFIMLYKVVLNFEYVDETLGETIHMKATKQ